MIDTKALRNRILDLAIQGKLTEQLESDGTAEELYQQIQAEKQKIIESGILKGKKKIVIREVSSDIESFSLPSTWKWLRLGEISEIFGRIGFRGYTKNDIVDENSGALSLSPSNITINGSIVFDKCTYITWEKYEESPEIQVNIGDIIIVKTGSSYGKSCIVDNLPCKATINPQLAILKYVLCNSNYLSLFLNASYTKKQLDLFVIGAATPTFSQENLANLLIPLPPLAEQKRIVERVEEIFRLLDTIDKAQEKYSADSQILKAKLITAGIQGKLTKQLESDGTAHELYQQIQEEKQKLIKEGKIKKEKPLPPISTDEIPFEIPQNWMWVRISDIFAVGTGSTPSKNEKKYYNGGDIPWVNSALTVNRYIEKVNTYITEYALNSLNLKLYAEHTLIIAMYGEGKTRGQISELLIPATTNQACAALSSIIYHQETINYVFYFFQNYYDNLRALAHGGNQPNLNLQKIKDVLIPLPPLAEQKRIADVLERVLGVVE